MILVSVINRVTNQRFSKTFSDKDTAQSWIQYCISTGGWGRPERWVYEYDLDSKREDKSRAVAKHLAGGPDEEIVMYKFAADYEIKVEELA